MQAVLVQVAWRTKEG